jgi:hypothetical protein
MTEYILSTYHAGQLARIASTANNVRVVWSDSRRADFDSHRPRFANVQEIDPTIPPDRSVDGRDVFNIRAVKYN